jgi:hypothetical protein
MEVTFFKKFVEKDRMRVGILFLSIVMLHAAKAGIQKLIITKL